MCGFRDQKQFIPKESNIKQYIIHEKFKNTTKFDIYDIMLLVMKVPFNHIKTFPKLYGCESLFEYSRKTKHKGLKCFSIACKNIQPDTYKKNLERKIIIYGSYGSNTSCQTKRYKSAFKKYI